MVIYSEFSYKKWWFPYSYVNVYQRVEFREAKLWDVLRSKDEDLTGFYSSAIGLLDSDQ